MVTHSVLPPCNALGLAELPGGSQLPRLLLRDTGLMACLSFPLPKNRDGHGGEGAVSGESVRHVSNSELSAQLILAINQVVTRRTFQKQQAFLTSLSKGSEQCPSQRTERNRNDEQDPIIYMMMPCIWHQ